MMVLLECKPDQALVMNLGVPRKRIKHHSNKGNVCKALKKSEGRCIGIVDRDPNSAQPSYLLKECKLLKSEHGIETYIDKKKNLIIVICPRLEEWLINVSANSKVSMKGLLNPSENLKDHINHRIPQLVSLIQKLLNEGSPELLYLRKLLNE